METEKRIFLLRLKKDASGNVRANVPDYDIDEFEDYLFNHAKRRRHLGDCDRNYITYLKTFIIPEEAVRGNCKTQLRNQFRNKLAIQLNKFINWKNARLEVQTVAAQVRSPSVCHRDMVFV